MFITNPFETSFLSIYWWSIAPEYKYEWGVSNKHKFEFNIPMLISNNTIKFVQYSENYLRHNKNDYQFKNITNIKSISCDFDCEKINGNSWIVYVMRTTMECNDEMEYSWWRAYENIEFGLQYEDNTRLFWNIMETIYDRKYVGIKRNYIICIIGLMNSRKLCKHGSNLDCNSKYTETRAQKSTPLSFHYLDSLD